MSANSKRLVFFEWWFDPVAERILRARPEIDLVRLEYAAPAERNWEAFRGAHGYQIAPRTELRDPWFGNRALIARCPELLAISSTDFQYDTNRYTYHQALDYMRGLRPDNKPGFTIPEKGLERSTVFGRARGIPVNVTYTLIAWTLYIEDMNQILEQILLKFSPIAYIRVRGVAWECVAKLDSIANNLDTEPGDQAIRVVKFQFNITAETYIPQPLVRKKAVLKTNVEFVDGMTEDEITTVMARLEEAVKELEC